MYVITGGKEPQSEDTSLHSFPENLPRLGTWLKFAQIRDRVYVLTSSVCSWHFSAKFFEQDLGEEVTGVTLIRCNPVYL